MTLSHDSLVGTQAPEFPQTAWLNSQPISLEKLRQDDKIVLVDFWTYSCVNCLRTLPHLSKWWQRYQDHGLVIIGVHSPEFAFEQDPANVQAAVQRLGVTWPIALDPKHKIWQQYHNHYWPRHLLVDHTGTIVYDHIGEGNYRETEQAIQRALQQVGASKLPSIGPLEHQHKLGAVCYPSSPETYLGNRRGVLKNREPFPVGKFTVFQDPKLPERPGVSLVGRWRIEDEYVANDPSDQQAHCSLIFSGLGVNLVASADSPTEVSVTLNDTPIQPEQRGHDITIDDSQTILTVDTARMYQLVSSKRPIGYGKLRLAPRGAMRAYVFTFGHCSDE